MLSGVNIAQECNLSPFSGTFVAQTEGVGHFGFDNATFVWNFDPISRRNHAGIVAKDGR